MSKNTTVTANAPAGLRQTVSVDLTAAHRDPVNIGTEWQVNVTQKRSAFNFFGSRKSIDTHVKVQIGNVKLPKELKLSATRPLFSIISSGKEYDALTRNVPGEAVDLHLTSTSASFSLFFHPEAVEDCTVKQHRDNVYPVSFSLSLTDEDGTEICSNEVTVNVSLAHVDTRPVVRFVVKRDLKESTYSNRRRVETVASLEVANESVLEYAPDVDVTLEPVFKRDGAAASDRHLWADVAKASDAAAVERDDDGVLHIRSLQRGRKIVIPVLADFAAIGNPVGGEGKTVFELGARVKYNNSNEPGRVEQLHVPENSFAVLQNAQQPSLEVKVRDPQSQKTYNVSPSTQNPDDRRPVMFERFAFLPGQGLELPIEINVANLATEGLHAAIYIKNPAVTARFAPDTTVRYRSARDNASTAFVLRGADVDTVLPNAPDSSRRWTLVFVADRISDIYRGTEQRNYNVNVMLHLSFDYYVDEHGDADIMPDFFTNPDNCRSFKVAISLPLYRKPNPNWLAIDFGTSAIVSKYAGNAPLDLHGRKKALDPSEDDYEKGSPFLSSNIVLRNIGEQETEGISQLMTQPQGTGDFNKLAVFLSPTSTKEKGNIEFAMPCLKLIVGYDLLPNIENYSRYNYRYLDPFTGELNRSGLVVKEKDDAGIEQDVYTPLAKVDTIFGEVYSQLFRFYLAPVIKDEARDINQLVLTIPNTYTPMHLQRISDIVRRSLSDLNVRNITFVSESDAVACYYQRNWADINRRIGREATKRLMESENVLVFDMGAGTLDVTLFAKDLDENDGHIDIRVLGKIGIAKAGNYLDSLIAELLTRVFPAMKVYSDPDEIKTGDRVKGAIMLKNFIKNEIKPRLSAKNPFYTFSEQREIGIRLDPKAIATGKDQSAKPVIGTPVDLRTLILEQPEFKDYIREVTGDFLGNFFRFFGIHGLKIDTVLLSGRSAKLAAIQKALGEAIRQWANPDARVIDISTLTDEKSTFDKSKTIVAEGAEIYAKLFSDAESSVKFLSPNLVACYGVIYRDQYGREQYTELLNPRTSPITGKKVENGMIIKTFKTPEQVFDLSATETVKLVQTFSADTAADWAAGNHEYITVMCEINSAAIAGRSSARLSLEVDGSNTMSFLINGLQYSGLAPMKIDINSRSNRRSLWPVMKH